MSKSKKRYHDDKMDDKEQVEVTEPDLSAFTQKSKKDKEHKQGKVVRDNSDNESGNGEPSPKKKSKKKYFQSVNYDGDNNILTHDLSKKNKAGFRYQPWRAKSSLQFMEKDKKNKGKGRPVREDPYPGEAPIPEDKIDKYKRGEQTELEGVKTKFHSYKLQKKEEKIEKATEQAARTELLLTEDAGYIEADEGEHTSDYTQHEIAGAVDISSAQKYFELKMDKFGPYRMNYTRNGRFLLMAGGKGHIAAVDWQTKKLMCEINVMETCQDAKWLHIETLFAVAQKQWTYVYDNQGLELHCLKTIDRALRLEFLPYHFLLAAANATGYLSWIDVSVGKKVAGFSTGLGRLDVMCQNPANAVIHLGHSGGTVTLWSPNVREPLVKMLCHGGGTRALSVTKDGLYMATSGIDRTLKVWDLRTFKMLHGYKVDAGAGHMDFSQRGLLATSTRSVVEVYRDPCRGHKGSLPYLSHRLPGGVRGMQFCPYEDVLGVGHSFGFSSLLVPGAGEPNFDALEANPYQSKKQRQQAEVKMLLEKVQPDMIGLDTAALGNVDVKSVQQRKEEKEAVKSRGPRLPGQKPSRKDVHDPKTREDIRQKLQEEKAKAAERDSIPKPYSALNRFANKTGR